MTTTTITVYTAEEVAEILRCDVKTVYRWTRKGLLHSTRREGQRAHRYTQEHLDAFLAGPKVETPGPKTPLPLRSPRYSK